MTEKGIEITKMLQPMFDRAEKEGLWFHASYQDLWFSPRQLQEMHAHGSFLWGSVNWELQKPSDRLANAERAVELAIKERDRIVASL